MPARNHRDGWIAGQCLKFLDKGVDPQRPLFLYLSFLKPHAGFNVPKEFEDLYDIDKIPDIAQPPWQRGAGHAPGCDRRQPAVLDQRYLAWRTGLAEA